MTISSTEVSSPEQARQTPTRDHDGLTSAERDAIADAAGTGVRAALWIRSLAERQDDEHNRKSLDRYAATVERILTREIVPDRYDELDAELRYALDAYWFMIEDEKAAAPFDLTPAERTALAAIGTAALAAPSTAMNNLAADLPRICALVDHALSTTHTATPEPA